MAKYEEPFEDTHRLFDEAITQTGIKDYLNIAVLTNNQSKELFKVSKASGLLRYRTGDDVYIILNEKIFEQLTEEQKRIAVEEAVAYIGYDFEKETLVITQPDFLAHSGILRKHNYPVIEVLRETIRSLYEKERQEEEEAKNKTKAKKKNW
jgi:TRAP-type mannitol/chloroaromatic compound transport system substrate-binding protein